MKKYIEKLNEFKLADMKSKIGDSIMWLESILAVFIIVFVLISFKDITNSMVEISKLNAQASYDLFQQILSHVLLLVIALELAIMLVKHNPYSVLEIMLYAVARKMLIYTSDTFDIFLGILSLAMIYFIKKYLLLERYKKIINEED